MKMPIAVQFCSCNFSYNWEKDLNGVYRIRFLLSNISTGPIELNKIRLLGEDDENHYAYPFSSAKIAFSKSLSGGQSESAWITLTDDVFYKLTTYKTLYLIIEFSIDGNTGNIIKKFHSIDWENHWDVYDTTVAGELDDYRDISETLGTRALEDTIKVKIIESKHQLLTFGENRRNAFTFLIDIKNCSAEDCLFKYSGFLLYDEDRVQLPFVNYLNGCFPSETPLKPGASDRICAVFPSDKSVKKDGELTLRFKITSDKSDFWLKETFEISHTEGAVKEVQHCFEMANPSPSEKRKNMEERIRCDEEEKAKVLNSKFKNEFQKIERKYDVAFSKITTIRDSDGTIILRGLKKDKGISSYCLDFAISIIDQFDQIISIESIRVRENESNWTAFEINFEKVPVRRAENVIITLKD